MQNPIAQVPTQTHMSHRPNPSPGYQLPTIRNPLQGSGRLTLRQKTLLFLSMTLTGLVGGIYLSSFTILSTSLKQAEQQSAEQTINGVLSVLGRDQKSFSARYVDWSAWDDTYAFIQDKNPDYIKSNLVPGQFSNLKINLALFVHKSGKVVFGSGFDLKSKQLLPVPTALNQHLVQQSLLLTEPQTKQTAITGLLLLPQGPMLITSQPILTSEGKGPIRGNVIFGRYLDEGAIADLSQATQLSLQAHRFDSSNLPADFQAAKKQLSIEQPTLIQPLNQEYLAGYVLLTDIYHQPGLILRVEIPREIYQQGRRSQFELIVMVTLVGLAFGGISLILLERLVLSRLAHLSKGIKQVKESQDLSLRIHLLGQDELSDLADNMNGLLSSLETSQNALQSNVLHLAEVNSELKATMFCLTEEIKERKQIQVALQHSEQELKQKTQLLEETLQDLQKAHVQLIQSEKMSSLGQLVAGVAHEINNPVGFIFGNINHANRYLEDLIDLIHLYRSKITHYSVEIQEKEEEIDLEFLLQDLPKLFSSMQVGVNRIRDIVLSLRTFSRLDEADFKAVDIHTGLDSTLMILEHRLKAQRGRNAIQVNKEYGPLPEVECYAGQLNQVFMNILANAIDALEEAMGQQEAETQGYSNAENSLTTVPRATSPSITIRTAKVDANRVQITIADNGPGIPETAQQKIFDPFFTTKPVGKGTGMGMSISYQIVVNKHKGNLRCESTPGEGAQFIVEIPINHKKAD